MVRPQLGPSHHTEASASMDPKDRYSQRRPHPVVRSNPSPGYGPPNYRRSPRRHSPSVRQPSNIRTDKRNVPRDQYRRESRGNVQSRGNRNSPRSVPGNNRRMTNPAKWRKNRNKKKRRGKGRRPLLSGGNCFPVASGNRQLIASMRMRMDDYATPRVGRGPPLGKSNNDIERAVARARREASTRTKDTFWTKKLLDAESSHPNRWAHSGFKEMYREELGYSELEYKEKERLAGRSPLRGSRDDFERKNDSQRSRTSPTNKQRKPSSVPSKGKGSSRKASGKSRSRSKSHSRTASRSRSPKGRKRSPHRGKATKSPVTGRKLSYPRSRKRSFSRSLSASSTTVTSRSRSRSNSRSYSSYSRSSSFSSTTSSSTFSSSSSSSLRSYRRRSYTRSKSWSRSPSVRRPITKIEAASLSKAVQSVHVKEKKKKLTKMVSSSSSAVQPNKKLYPTPGMGAKSKPKLPRSASNPSHSRHSGSIVSQPSISAAPPVVAAEYYEKEVDVNRSPGHVDAPEKVNFESDVIRGPESQCFKGGSFTNHEITTSQPMATRSEGEQSNSESSSEDDDAPLKMTLSERFGKLAQLSSQRQEYEGVRMKIVREGGQDKKVYLEGDSRSPSPVGRRSNVAHERWLREHKAEYDEYEERYGEFRQWDPHRDLPRELPPNWDDVNVRYRYYKESGYFGDRSITMEDYLKWEEWWYRYRDWLEKYGGVQEDSLKTRGPYGYDMVRGFEQGQMAEKGER